MKRADTATDTAAILASVRREEEERHLKIRQTVLPQLRVAIGTADWEKASSLITLNPEIMEEGLALAYPLLPDRYKFRIPTDC